MELNYKKCEFCKKESSCLCYKCMTYFCDSCFKLAHENEEFKSHKKEKIDLYISMDVKCPEHKLHPMDLFCITEKGNNKLYIIFRILLFFVLL